MPRYLHDGVRLPADIEELRIARSKQARRQRSNEDRFEDSYTPEPNSGCWLWTRSTSSTGYGTFVMFFPDGKSKPMPAHRAAWLLLRGEIPPKFDIDHLCRNEACVNPDHLEPVSHAENCRRGLRGALYRKPEFCPEGHPYSGSNLKVNKHGHPLCRECTNRWHRESRLRKKLAATEIVLFRPKEIA